MRYIIATNNNGKLKEFREQFKMEFIPYREAIGDLDIEENGNSFKENALIKAREVYRISGKGSFIISDDSGLSVPVLGGEPNIYSARYAGDNATDMENLEKLIYKLKEKNIEKTEAYYTASIAIVGDFGEYTAHGWCFGDIITTPKGNRGFGYDPIFIPYGYSKTFGELDISIKKMISHRSKAIENIRQIVDIIISNSSNI